MGKVIPFPPKKKQTNAQLNKLSDLVSAQDEFLIENGWTANCIENTEVPFVLWSHKHFIIPVAAEIAVVTQLRWLRRSHE